MIKEQKNLISSYTLGLDIGVASVGAAILAQDKILGLHVRTFEKAETDKEGDSLNKIRREARLTRRRVRRRAHRMLRLLRLMKHEGLISLAKVETFQQGEKNPISPWELRAIGLERKLTREEWAAALYHIVKHRGFESNRKGEEKKDKKVGEMLSGVNANRQLLDDKQYQTVGEMVLKDERFEKAKRNKAGNYQHTLARPELESELKILFQKQRQYQNPHTDIAFEEKVHALLMARKPALSGADLRKMVGNCTFETDEKRAPKASYSAERFVWLTKLNNLKISEQGTERALTEQERLQLIEVPFQSSKITYKQIRDKLDISDSAYFNGLSYDKKKNGEDKTKAEEAIFFEAKYFHALRLKT
jgi:CRISPR-associated endonuclease Csn1